MGKKERKGEKREEEEEKKNTSEVFQVRDEDRIIKQSYSGPAEREAIRAHERSPRIFFETIFRDRPERGYDSRPLKVYRRFLDVASAVYGFSMPSTLKSRLPDRPSPSLSRSLECACACVCACRGGCS